MEVKIITNCPNYSINNVGIITNIKTNKIINGTITVDGYISVKLYNKLGERKSFKIHRLVAEAFIKNDENKLTVDHIDRNRKNNNVINLKWATSKEQNQNKKQSTNQREKLGRAVNRIDIETNSIIETYNSLREASEWLLQYNGNQNKNSFTHISSVCTGKNKSAYGFKWCFTDNIVNYSELWKELLPELVNDVKRYKISNLGRIKGRTGRINTGWDNNGYTHVSIGNKSYQLHRLVALAFIKSNDLKKIEVNHIDGNKKNNELTNLEWVTHKENVQHAFDTGLSPTRYVVQYNLSGEKIRSYNSIAEAERTLQITHSQSYISIAIDKEKKANGFIWRSTEVINAIPEKVTFDISSKKPCKKIIQYASNGITLLNEFESAKKVSEIFNVNKKTVSAWCTGHRKMNKGFIFKYK